MKRFSTFASITMCSVFFLTAGCYMNYSGPKSEESSEQAVETEVEKAEKGEKGKFEMSEEVPPAPGDEEAAQEQEFVQKQTQKQQEPVQKQEEPAQKQTQKQMY